jgi:hypothetical protein
VNSSVKGMELNIKSPTRIAQNEMELQSPPLTQGEARVVRFRDKKRDFIAWRRYAK